MAAAQTANVMAEENIDACAHRPAHEQPLEGHAINHPSAPAKVAEKMFAVRPSHRPRAIDARERTCQIVIRFDEVEETEVRENSNRIRRQNLARLSLQPQILLQNRHAHTPLREGCGSDCSRRARADDKDVPDVGGHAVHTSP